MWNHHLLAKTTVLHHANAVGLVAKIVIAVQATFALPTSKPGKDHAVIANRHTGCFRADFDHAAGHFMTRCTGARRRRRDGPFLSAGGGEVGRKVAQLLNDCGEQTFMIDSEARPGVDLVGNVLDTQVLKQAGIENAQAVILALRADATTLFSTVIIKDMAPDVPVIARVNSAENVERLYGAGADFALSISQVSGQLLALRLLGKEAVAVDHELQVIKVSTRGLDGLQPQQNDLREKTGCSVVAVERGDELLVEFSADFVLQPGDAVYICGSAGAAQVFNARYPQK